VNDIIWTGVAVALAIHDEQIAEHGGRSGIRDVGLLESALERPRNLFAYEAAGLIRLAAAYGFGLARNHLFVDGNKRTSAVVTELFMERNGFRLLASDAAMVATWTALAEGRMKEEELAPSLGECSPYLSPTGSIRGRTIIDGRVP
jgi:death-on-curing protein